MNDYRPPAYEYQQLVYGGATRGVDCTAWVGAWLTDAHTFGKTKISGRTIRVHSDEPYPDEDSPGLNARQVRDSVYEITDRKVWLPLAGVWTPEATTSSIQAKILNGQPTGIAVIRGRLIDRMPQLGAINGFRGAHQVGLILDDGVLYLFDPLSSIYLRADFADVWYAAAAVAGSEPGHAFAFSARDIIPSSYEVVIDPAPEAFWTYRIDNGVAIRRRHPSVGTDHAVVRACTKLATYRYAGGGTRTLVRVTQGGSGSIAKSSYPFVSPDASAIHYRGVLP